MVLLGTAQLAAGDIPVNGSFEDAGFDPLDASYRYLIPDDAPSGWTYASDFIGEASYLTHRSHFSGIFQRVPADGDFHLTLNDGDSIGQQFSTQPTVRYALSFYAFNTESLGTSPLQVYIGGLVTHLQLSDGALTTLPVNQFDDWYRRYTVEFTAESSQTSLVFLVPSQGVDFAGWDIDAITLQPVAIPEPTSAVLALVTIYMLTRRR